MNKEELLFKKERIKKQIENEQKAIEKVGEDRLKKYYFGVGK